MVATEATAKKWIMKREMPVVELLLETCSLRHYKPFSSAYTIFAT